MINRWEPPEVYRLPDGVGVVGVAVEQVQVRGEGERGWILPGLADFSH